MGLINPSKSVYYSYLFPVLACPNVQAAAGSPCSVHKHTTFTCAAFCMVLVLVQCLMYRQLWSSGLFIGCDVHDRPPTLQLAAC